MNTFSLTIDLDTPTEYAALHGISLATEDPHLVYRAPLTRFASLCESLQVHGTVFAVTRDVCGIAVHALGRLLECGFEVGSHSHQHDYQLTRRHPGYVLSDIRTSRAVLQQELGVSPVGFRAPGHHMSVALLDELQAHGFQYTSSVLPCPLYYAAKAAVMTSYWLAARPTAALLGSAKIGFAPRQPYHPGQSPYARGGRQIWELPISVAGRTRLPAIGSAFLLTPASVRTHLLRGLERESHLIVNLHAMDFVDADRDGLPESIARRQPELRVPIEERLERLRRDLGQLRRNRRDATLGELIGLLD